MPEGRSKSEEEIHTFAQHKMRKQDSAHADSGQKRSLYRRAHETSPDLRSSETGIGRAWEIPVLASETLTAFTRTACCFIGRFCKQGSAQSGSGLLHLSSALLPFASQRISTLWFPEVLESQLMRTKRWSLQREVQRNTISACAGEIVECLQRIQGEASLDLDPPGISKLPTPTAIHAHCFVALF